ncbi:glycoside hydrolase family 125 protein, partial [Melanomma pulvis-pyrius CBS 109.77]
MSRLRSQMFSPSRRPYSQNSEGDNVQPLPTPSQVFQCKHELDSLSHFLTIANTFHDHTDLVAYFIHISMLHRPRHSCVRPRLTIPIHLRPRHWQPRPRRIYFLMASNPLSLGLGSPLNIGTCLVRSFFRHSDDATIFPFLIPSNAQMADEL